MADEHNHLSDEDEQAIRADAAREAHGYGDGGLSLLRHFVRSAITQRSDTRATLALGHEERLSRDAELVRKRLGTLQELANCPEFGQQVRQKAAEVFQARRRLVLEGSETPDASPSKNCLQAAEDVLSAGGRTFPWPWHKPREGATPLAGLDLVGVVPGPDSSADLLDYFPKQYELHWPNLDTLRAMYLAQDDAGKCAMVDHFVNFASASRNNLPHCSTLVAEFLLRTSPRAIWKAFLKECADRIDNSSVSVLNWLRLRIRCEHAALSEQLLRDAIEIARLARARADTLLRADSRMPLPARMATLAAACESAAHAALSRRHHTAYVEGITWELNQDRIRATEILEAAGIPTSAVQPLKELDDMFREAGTPFRLAAFIAACRSALEPLVKAIATRVHEVDPKQLGKPPDASFQDALHCLQEHDLLHDRERALLKALYDAVSTTGSHSSTGDRERARIMKNMVIEAVLLCARRFRDFRTEHGAASI